MKREDICKEKLDNKEQLNEVERQHYTIRKGHRPIPKIGFGSEYEIFMCGLYIKKNIDLFYDIEECPLCGKLHLKKKEKKNGKIDI